MTDLITRFESAIHNSSMSGLEVAWSIHVEPDQLKEIINGKQTPNDKQSEHIERFIAKSYRRIVPTQGSQV